MKNSRLVLIVIGLGLPAVTNAQFGRDGTEQAVSDFIIDPEALKLITEAGEAGGKDIRWLTLVEKTTKIIRTDELTEAKQKQNDLQREELGKVAKGLSNTLDLFDSYYEKFQLLSGAVRTLAEARKFTQRVASFIEAVQYVYSECKNLDQLEPQELKMIENYLDGMIRSAEQIVEKGDILLLDKNTQSEEMDQLKEEHGSFFVTMRAIDRTEQLNALNSDIAALSSDLHRLVAYITSTIKQRSYVSRNTDALSRLFDRL